MAFLVSPGVQVQEKDLTNVIPAVSTSIGGYVGEFRWGPTGQVVQVSSEVDLANIFGKPTASFAKSFLTAASFLKYGNTLKVSRAVGAVGYESRNAIATYFANGGTSGLVAYSGSAQTIGNVDQFNAAGSLGNSTFIARYPGQVGASLGVYVVTANSTGSSIDINPAAAANGANLNICGQFDNVPSYSSNNPVIVKATTGSGQVLTVGSNSGITAGMFAVGKGIAAPTYVTGTYSSTFTVTSTASTGSISLVVGTNSGLAIGMIVSGTNIVTGSTITYAAATSSTITISTGTTGTIASASTLTYTDLTRISLSQSLIASGTSAYTGSSAATGASAITFFEPDQVHVLVVDLDGGISGTPGTILEKFPGLSLFTDGKKSDGTNIYYKDYINRNSSYVWVNSLSVECSNADTSITGTAVLTIPTSIGTNALAHVCGNANLPTGSTAASNAYGRDGGTTTGGTWNTTTAIDFLADAETVDVNLIFGSDVGESALSTTEGLLQSTANTRKDCIAFLSAPLLAVSQATSNTAKLSAIQTKYAYATYDSYSVFDSTPLYVYNKYQDNYVWIPACGHIAGLCANTDNVADAWWSPAGYSRGNLKDVTKLAYNPDQAGRDTLYKANINPIVAFPGQGILLFGDKTAQAKPSAFDRINVRRLFIVLEKAIATAAKYQLFELNDQDRKSTRLNSSHVSESRMPSSA